MSRTRLSYQHGSLLIGQRFMWWAPWRLSEPWRPRLWQGGDEYGNPSHCFTLPVLGAVILFLSPHLSTTPLED